MMFSSETFWDINPATLDMERHAQFIIERVALRGQWHEWLELQDKTCMAVSV
jgi:hypothetical protein